jgi:FkbM family methyltransferase
MKTRKILIGGESYNLSTDDDYLTDDTHNFEPHLITLFDCLCGKNDVVMDVGANIGATSLFFANKCKSVFSFEPSPSTYALLNQNLHRARATNVQAFNLGLGEKTAENSISFAPSFRAGGFVGKKTAVSSGHVTETIKIETIDNVVGSMMCVAPTFIKIDTEGYEMNVLKGGTRIIKEKKPTAILEMNGFCLDVLQRITLPDFLDYVRHIFPVAIAIDGDNSEMADLHDPNQAYHVMHQHFVHQKFPNIVCGFNKEIHEQLEVLTSRKKLSDRGSHEGKPLPLVMDGWSRDEGTHRWSEGNKSNIQFLLEKGQCGAQRLELEGFALDGQTASLTLNGRSVCSLTLPVKPECLSLALPAGALKEGRNTLELVFPHAKYPANGDPRKLAYAIIRLRLRD